MFVVHVLLIQMGRLFMHFAVTFRLTLKKKARRKQFYQKKGSRKCWSDVCLVYDNVASHMCNDVTAFLKSENVRVVNHPPFSPDLSTWDNLCPKLKKILSGKNVLSRSSLGIAIRQCLHQILRDDYLVAFQEWLKGYKNAFGWMGRPLRCAIKCFW